MIRNALLAALILIALPACDNVSWGGAELSFVPPPPKGVEEEVDGPEAVAVDALPRGPVLYYARRGEAGAELVPIGEVRGDSLGTLGGGPAADRFWTRFVAEQLREGSEFVLFRMGRRVGTFVVESANLPQPGSCPELPQAYGVTELAADAGEAAEFLALPKRYAPETREPVDTTLFQAGRRMSIVGPILAERMLRARGAGLPGNWLGAMRQAVPFPVTGPRDPAFTATFLVGDTLGPGLNDEGYSLFFIASPDPGATGYDTTFVRFTDYRREGKAAPRVVDFLDWNRDGEVELLLEVYGTRDRWFEALSRVDGRWQTVYRLRCESPEAAAAALAAADSALADTVTGPGPGQPETGVPPP